MADPNKPTSKESVHGEITSLLMAHSHAEIDAAAKKLANTLDELLHNKNLQNEQNKQMFMAAVAEMMAVPKTPNFNAADLEVQAAFLDILEHIKDFLGLELGKLANFNAEIKAKKQRLKEKIEEADARFRRGM